MPTPTPTIPTTCCATTTVSAAMNATASTMPTVTARTSAPPRPRIAMPRDVKISTRAPARVSGATRRKRASSKGSGGATPWEELAFGGDGGDGGDWFDSRGGGGGGGDGGGGSGDDDESADDDDDSFDFEEELLAYERRLWREMESMDANVLYAWQSVCAVTLVGCVQHVIDTAWAHARRGALEVSLA